METLKKAIRGKFGTLSNFARQARIDRYWLQKAFARKVMLPGDVRSLKKALRVTRCGLTPTDVDPKKIDALRASIIDAGGAAEFCRRYPGFNLNSLKQILQMRRKRMSPVIRRLFDHFEI